MRSVAPSPPRNLKSVWKNSSSVLLQWEVPQEANGDVDQYQLQYRLGYSNDGTPTVKAVIAIVVNILVSILWFHRVNFSEIAHIFVKRRFNTVGPRCNVLSISVKSGVLYPSYVISITIQCDTLQPLMRYNRVRYSEDLL